MRTDHQSNHYTSNGFFSLLVQFTTEIFIGTFFGVLEFALFASPTIVFATTYSTDYLNPQFIPLFTVLFGLIIGSHRVGTNRNAVHNISPWNTEVNPLEYLKLYVNTIRTDGPVYLLIISSISLCISLALIHLISGIVSPIAALIVSYVGPLFVFDPIYRNVIGRKSTHERV